MEEAFYEVPQGHRLGVSLTRDDMFSSGMSLEVAEPERIENPLVTDREEVPRSPHFIRLVERFNERKLNDWWAGIRTVCLGSELSFTFNRGGCYASH
jgi:hypothetical protein